MGWLARAMGYETREYHEDGSTTDRSDGFIKSVTRNSDGSIRHYSYDSDPLIGPKSTITKDGNGKIINSN
jgi:hypothetical protein